MQGPWPKWLERLLDSDLGDMCVEIFKGVILLITLLIALVVTGVIVDPFAPTWVNSFVETISWYSFCLAVLLIQICTIAVVGYYTRVLIEKLLNKC